MKKIGIFGGTFDPIHRLHLRIALAAKERLALDRMILVPTGNPPHKNNEEVTAFVHRKNMTALAVQSLEGFEVSDIENEMDLRKSYTSDTLDAFAERYPRDRLYFIVGSDSLFDIENWKNPANIFEKAVLVVFHRPNISTRQELAQKMNELRKKYQATIIWIEIFAEDLSSTDIRIDLQDGVLSTNSISPSVAEYIKEHKLYER